MTSYDRLIASIESDTPLPAGDALELLAKCPCFSLPASRALLDPSLDESLRRKFLSAVALNAPDVKTLITLIEPGGVRFAGFYPDEKKNMTPTTESAIDTFLDTYGHGIDPREEALLERLIFNPTPDYSEVLAREAAEEPVAVDPAEKSEQDSLLDAFIDSQNAQHVAVQPPPADEPKVHHRPDPEAPLSESLAKIFIKRGRYDKAFEIIKQLSLNFPEKSVYFADQLRFLQKLIVVQRYEKAKKQKD
ncbi:MAG: hypothetical protein K2G01_06345 [Paramuribaculum sp.]|nr:hypothetical protein [Paramuribaculum sp.]MDE6323437.1 hypothetical protein [Paramuribaculum sp.]